MTDMNPIPLPTETVAHLTRSDDQRLVADTSDKDIHGILYRTIQHTRPDSISRPMAMPVFPLWILHLPYQQQSVLMAAIRGPDGLSKSHPCKELQRHFRGTVLIAARYGRSLIIGEAADTFMSLEFARDKWVENVCKPYFDAIDELPHHYHLHMMHAAQIIGYKHPSDIQRANWRWFYTKCCEDMHLPVESEQQMDGRLSDWHCAGWD